jgi:hypothetical protein
MINLIKKHFLKRCLEKNKPARERQVISFEQVKTMGILCQITDEASYKAIHELFAKIQSLNRTVWLMGYTDTAKVPYFCLPQLSADYYTKKNVNWYGKPHFVQLNDFIHRDFDILIDFSRRDLPPLRYILAASKAKLIIGANEHRQDLYDIFIDDKTGMDHLKLLKTIHNYLLKLTGK